MPTISAYIPDESPLAAKIQKKADRFHDGKVSQYVRSLVEKDLGYAPEAVDDEGPFLRLVREVRPACAASYRSHACSMGSEPSSTA